MTKSLFLVLWFCLTTIPSRTIAELNDASHLSPFFHEQKSISNHAQGGHKKRKRGGRNYVLKRCSASKHSQASDTSAATQDSADTNLGTPGKSKKWGLGWPNGDASCLANFARPKVG